MYDCIICVINYSSKCPYHSPSAVKWKLYNENKYMFKPWMKCMMVLLRNVRIFKEIGIVVHLYVLCY